MEEIYLPRFGSSASREINKWKANTRKRIVKRRHFDVSGNAVCELGALASSVRKQYKPEQ